MQLDSDSMACDSSVRTLFSGWGRRPRPSPLPAPRPATLAPPLALRPSPRLLAQPPRFGPNPDPRLDPRQVALEARLDEEERSRLASLRALCPGYFALPGKKLDDITPASTQPNPHLAQTLTPTPTPTLTLALT